MSTTLTTEQVSFSNVSTTACSADGNGGGLLLTVRVASANVGRDPAELLSPRAGNATAEVANAETSAWEGNTKTRSQAAGGRGDRGKQTQESGLCAHL
jgi:hypothetical protein